MSKFKIPSDERKFSQINDGDTSGNLWLTQNIDLKSNKGKIRVSPRLVVNTSSVDDTDLGQISAFARFWDRKGKDYQGYWCQAGSVLFKNLGNITNPTKSFSQDDITGTPTSLDYRFSDMIVAPNGLLVSSAGDIFLFDGTNDWVDYWQSTLSQSALDSSCSHLMEIMFNLVIAVGNGNKIATIVSPYTASGNVTATKVTLRAEDHILWIKSSSTRVWIGTYNTSGGEGLVYEWDGASATTARAYKTGARGALAGVIKGDIPWIMTSDGSLKYFNGAGFTVATQLPHTATQYLLGINSDANPKMNTKWIHPNGMKLIDGNINININNILDESTAYAHLIENEPSGIWEYDPQIGLVHKYAPTLDATGSLDSGQNGIGWAGAIMETKARECALLAGMSVYTADSSVLKHAIYNDNIGNDIAKVGIITTPWIQSSEIEDVWQKLWVKFKDFDNATDKIVVKYRTRKDPDLPSLQVATWTSTSTFTITSASDLQTTTNILDVGNEVEIILGGGAGTSAHISSVSVIGTYTYTITLDEAIGPASSTSKVRFNNFKKLANISTQNITDKVLALGKTGTELQVKLELRGTGDNPEINQLVILSNPQLPIK